MRAEQWRRLDAILSDASRMAPERRADFLREQCGDDAELLELALARERESSAGSAFLQAPGLQSVVAPGDEVELEGRQLGEFRIEARIGSGGMGVVYRAVQTSLDRRVAVKVLFGSTLRDKRAHERFDREARAAAKLDHPGIVRVFSVGRESGLAYLAMELVEGPDLAAEIARLQDPSQAPRVLPAFAAPEYLRCASELVAQAADALEYAHAHGVIHRDVKSANLLVDGARRIRVVDFGLARDASSVSMTRSGEPAGTPAYMSPEQVEGKSSALDARTDVYSLGVVLYELLSLRRPFEGPLEQTLSKILHATPIALGALNRRVPRDLALICATAMARDPRDRYATAGALRDDLQRFLRGEAIAACPPPVWRRAREYVRRRRVPALVLAASCVALIAGARLSTAGAARSARNALPNVSIALSAESLAALPAGSVPLVTRRAIDPLTGERGPALELGVAPLVDEHVPPGNWRWSVAVAGYGFSEQTRWLAAEGPGIDLVATIRPSADLMAKMHPIGACDFDFGDPRAFGCRSEHSTTSIEAYWIDPAEGSNAEYIEYLEQTKRPIPTRWRNLGCTGDWRTLPIGPDLDRFLSLPIAGLYYEEAQAYAEWAGKRLATHAELERALRGAARLRYPSEDERELGLGGECNVNGTDVQPPGDARVQFDTYLANARPVRDPRYRQAPEGLFHAFGNVAEYTESLFPELVANRLVSQPLERLYLGGMWDAQLNKQSLEFHAMTGIGPEYMKGYVGIRCCKSDAP